MAVVSSHSAVRLTLLVCAHYARMLGDSTALTSGVIAATAPERRDASLAVYAFFKRAARVAAAIAALTS